MVKGKASEEEIKNCPACKKHLNKAKRYYRDGHYYCNKNCWSAMVKKTSEEAVA